MSDIPTSQLADLRRRVLKGEPVSAEEYRVVLDSIRSSRKTTSVAAKPKKAGKASNALLDQELSALD